MRAACIALLLLPVGAVAQNVSPTVTFSVPSYRLTEDEVQTVAACLVLEAASQGERGMRGVMSVIHNRAHGNPVLFAPVVLEPRQFSALNKVTSGRESLWRCVARARSDRTWATAVELVREAQGDGWRDVTGGATHYTRTAERIYWTRSLTRTAVIGAHSFYH